MIRIYTASADNTIVNTFKENLTTRATASNTGVADILEVYSIYGRQTTSSQELSRILVQFPITQIANDRTTGAVPASGSVNFYLNLYNATTSKTVPKNMTLVINPLYNSWQEGVGLDLEEYKDITRGNEGSNWVTRANTPGVEQIINYTFTEDAAASYAAGAGLNYVKLYSGTTRYNVWFNAGSDSEPTGVEGTAVQVNISAAGNKEAVATAFRGAVNGLSDFTAEVSSGNVVKVTTVAKGFSTISSIQGTLPVSDAITIEVEQKGSVETPWHSVSGGGDFLSSSADFRFEQTFDSGLENLNVDITPLVERWIKGAGEGSPPGIANYGVGIKLTSSQEALNFSSQVKASSDKSTQNIPDGATKSYYTKRFFARGTQYYFKRPTIEAKWNSTRRDHRGQFYISSSLAKSENINDIYFYNYVRGRLRTIPSSDSLTVSIYSSSAGVPTSARLKIKNTSNTLVDSVTATQVETGVYKARLQVMENLNTMHDVWSLGPQQVHTGTISATTLGTAVHAREPSYRLNITNLQNSYTPRQVARFNLYVREKNWNPTIYTKAIASAPTITIPSASYRVVREYDNLEAISHDTGSGVLATGLSYDVSGNYFDFDMSLLEPDYEYCFKFAFYDEELDSWQEQNESFKFRVNKNEY